MARHDLPEQAQLPIKTQFRETKILVFAQLWGKQGAEVSETWGWKTGAAVTLPICIKHSDPALPAKPLHACQHSYHSGTKEPPSPHWLDHRQDTLSAHTHRSIKLANILDYFAIWWEWWTKFASPIRIIPTAQWVHCCSECSGGRLPAGCGLPGRPEAPWWAIEGH